MAEHAELIETSLVNYLTPLTSGNPAASVWSASLQSGSSFRIFAGENNEDKDGSCILVFVQDDLGPEDPPCSGNRWADVTIELRTSFNIPTETEASPLVNHKLDAAALETAILADTLPDLLTASIDGFRCFGIDGDRKPYRNQDENYWASGYKLRIYSCPSTIPD
jgi:hypothetical protein